MKWTIKQAAAVTGFSADTLRYYEKEGMLSPKRHENGYRYYDDNDITVLKNIAVMKYAHFSLAEMKSMEELYAREPNTDCNKIARRILNGKIVELNRSILNYRKIVKLLTELLPMVDSIDAYLCNEKRIGEFIDQIFNDIRCGD
ncbi:MAG: MerR family transcriptional regulator [Oscillospiraceae bacterium]|nr:MerR family transcriptional regulator [Oscillospiraceae bacterium]